MIREIFNQCSGNQMRDVDIQEVETNDIDSIVKEFLTGDDVMCEKIVQDAKTTVFKITTDGLKQQVSFVKLSSN